jgi:ABC-type maltose transport system permease subunit
MGVVPGRSTRLLERTKVILAIVIAIAAAMGLLTAFIFAGQRAFFVAAFGPWAGLLAWQLLYEFFLSNKPANVESLFVAQMILGSIVALVSVVTYSWSRRRFDARRAGSAL